MIVFQCFFTFCAAIGGIRVHIAACIGFGLRRFVQNLLKHLRIMNGCCGDLILPYNFVFVVNLRVIFIPVMPGGPFFRKGRVGINLCFLGRRQRHTRLFLFCVLACGFVGGHKGRIHNLALLRHHAILV